MHPVLGTALAGLVLGLLIAGSAPAQQYPARPVRIIVPFPAAGAVDATTRIVGERLSARWGQPVIVDNRPGAASNIGAASTIAHIKAGKLKPLAIGGNSRLHLLPEVPTFAEQGFPGIPSNRWFGPFAPAGTPREVMRGYMLETLLADGRTRRGIPQQV